MKIAMIDPSLFTLPYDTAICTALVAKGGDVALYGRGLRALESAPGEPARAFFYKLSERLKGRIPASLFQGVKGLEHVANMARLVSALRREQPMVVHFQWLPLPAIDIISVRQIRRSVGPVVLTMHDMTPFNNAPTSAIQRVGSRGIWREFDHLIVHSEASRNLLAQQGLPPERISVIPHGILSLAPARFRPVSQDGPLTILLFGSIKAYKGLDVMIDALGRLPALLRKRCQVLVVGEPMIPIEPLKRRAAVLDVAGNITWDLRYVSEAEMGEAFSMADIFAFPYREIDTSGVLMSCLRYGKPIIASRIGAFQSLLQDRKHGRIVPPNDPAALAEAIGAVLADPSMLKTWGRNVAFLGDQIPSWDAIAGQTMALYETLVRARETAGGVPVTPPIVAA